jgi:hypothetical protein
MFSDCADRLVGSPHLKKRGSKGAHRIILEALKGLAESAVEFFSERLSIGERPDDARASPAFARAFTEHIRAGMRETPLPTGVEIVCSSYSASRPSWKKEAKRSTRWVSFFVAPSCSAPALHVIRVPSNASATRRPRPSTVSKSNKPWLHSVGIGKSLPHASAAEEFSPTEPRFP